MLLSGDRGGTEVCTVCLYRPGFSSCVCHARHLYLAVPHSPFVQYISVAHLYVCKTGFLTVVRRFVLRQTLSNQSNAGAGSEGSSRTASRANSVENGEVDYKKVSHGS